MAVAGLVGLVEEGDEGSRIKRVRADRQLVGLAGVAHVEDGPDGESLEGEAFGFQFGAAVRFEIGADNGQAFVHPWPAAPWKAEAIRYTWILWKAEAIRYILGVYPLEY